MKYKREHNNLTRGNYNIKDDGKDLPYEDPEEELLRKGIYYITGDIDENSLLTIHQSILLKSLDTRWVNDIQLIINSSGGECAEGWALVDLLQWIDLDVRTLAIGECCSMAAILVACGTKGKRYAAPNSTLMIHAPFVGSVFGNIHQLNDQMKDMQNEHERHVFFWLQNSKYTTKESVEENLLSMRDHYFTAEEAIKHGIIDKISTRKNQKTKWRKYKQKH